MGKNLVIRKSEITQYTWCPYAYHLLRKGISPSQTLQDLITQKKIPPDVVRHLQQQNIPTNTPLDKLIEKHILPQKIEKEIIKSNIMLQGTQLHESFTSKVEHGAGVQEHKMGYILVLLIILGIIAFLVLILLQKGGGLP